MRLIIDFATVESKSDFSRVATGFCFDAYQPFFTLSRFCAVFVHFYTCAMISKDVIGCSISCFHVRRYCPLLAPLWIPARLRAVKKSNSMLKPDFDLGFFPRNDPSLIRKWLGYGPIFVFEMGRMSCWLGKGGRGPDFIHLGLAQRNLLRRLVITRHILKDPKRGLN